MHDHGVVCVFFSLDIVPELTAPTNKARQRLTNFIRPGSRGRSQSKTTERYISSNRSQNLVSLIFTFFRRDKKLNNFY